MDFTAVTTLQRERGEDDATDVVGDLPRLLQASLTIRWRCITIAFLMPDGSLWFTRNRDTSILGVDEDRSSGRLACLTEVRREASVPAAPQCRLVRNRLQTQLFAELRTATEALDSAVSWFHHGYLLARIPERGWPYRSVWHSLAVVCAENEVDQWKRTGELLDRVMSVVFEPRLRDNANPIPAQRARFDRTLESNHTRANQRTIVARFAETPYRDS